MRYDACVIGAGADGLAAASSLARAGLKVIVVEKNGQPGGRCVLREFHPGFRAAPFCDSLAPFPSEVFRGLDLARRGIFLAPPSATLALWPDRRHWLHRSRPSSARTFLRDAARATDAALAHAARDAAPPPRRAFLSRPPKPAPWPRDDRFIAALADLAGQSISDPDAAAHVVAQALEGRAADPFQRGSALHLLAPPDSGLIVPGLAEVLADAAREAGAEILCDAEVVDIARANDRVSTVGLADGTQIEARTVLSTLDLKRTFLSLFQWDALAKPVAQRIGAFRMAAGRARLLIALDRTPALAADALRATIHVAPDPARTADAYAAWRAGVVPEHPPLTLRIVSASIPALAPLAQAVLTATLGCIPSRLFDGAWTHDKRDRLREAALAAIERVLPGTRDAMLAVELIVPPDIEEALGATDGDLMGGEIAFDQMFAARPGFDIAAPRTPIDGLYLAGPSSAAGPLGSGAAVTIATAAMIDDLKSGRLK